MGKKRLLWTALKVAVALAVLALLVVLLKHIGFRNILRAVEVERRVMAVILCLTVLVTGFLIFSILHTTVVEKTRDIGILKALGGTVRGIMSIFLINYTLRKGTKGQVAGTQICS